jgi:hypothetical protein
MKKKILKKIFLFTFLITSVYLGFNHIFSLNQKRADFNEFLDNHAYSNRNLQEVDLKSIPKKDRPDLAMEQNYLMIVDPSTLTVPYNKLVPAFEYTNNKFRLQKLSGKRKQSFTPLQVKSSVLKKTKTINNSLQNKNNESSPVAIVVGGNEVVWKERGPDNVGGRTRTLLWDPNDATNSRVFTGGTTGGLWVNDDVIDENSSWRPINDFLANLAITTLAYDPTNPLVFYAGTGEGWFNFGAVRGTGIFKSVNGGLTWDLLSSTNGNEFAYIQKIVVTSTGTIITATKATNNSSGGIFRSTDNGTTFTKVLSTRGSDIEVAANGDIYASRGILNTGTIFKSTDDGLNWTDVTPPGGNPQRIEIATAPSDANILYAIAQEASDNTIDWVQKSVDAGATWTTLTIPTHKDQCSSTATDITRSQAWYNLILAVSPVDPDVVIVGGVDLGRTDDGGQTWTQISEWANCSSLEDVHADQHIISFRPNNSNEAIFGNDGGVYYSSNVGGTSVPIIEARNKNYSITQFYSCATDNIASSEYYIAGAQDNGVQQLRSDLGASAFEVIGGDGAFTHIDQLDRNYQLGASQFGNVSHSSDGGSSFVGVTELGTGNFINQSDYDNTAGILYSTADVNEIGRITNVKSTSISDEEAVTLAIGDRQISAIRANANTANRIFIGTEGGLVFKIDDANALIPIVTEITNNITSLGNVSCIDIGATDNELIVTYSNFGVISVWYSIDGGTTWTNKDDTGHGLPDIPIRWVLFNPNDTKQVLLATELGVWSTNDITATNPDWEPTNEGLANVRCDMIQYREIDAMIVVATYGRGLFTSNIFAATADTTGPIITALTPTDDETNVQPLDVNLEIQFDEPVQIATGNVVIHLASDDSVVESIPVTSDKVNTAGTRIIINPTNDFVALTSYYVKVDVGAITDNFNNAFTGITNNTTWNFTVFDGDFAPTVNIPISPITVNENSSTISVDVSNIFDDADNDNALITLSIHENSNVATVSTNLVGNTLTLTPQTDKIGVAEITLRATSNGKTEDHIISITVNSTSTSIFEQAGPTEGSGQGEGVYNNGTNQNVDDFIVPNDVIWKISTVTTQAFALGGANLNLQSVDVIVYNDAAGEPGTVFKQQTILANQGKILGGTLNNASLTVRLNNIMEVPTGTYWISILPTFDVVFGSSNTTGLYAWFVGSAAGNSFSSSGNGVFTSDNNEMLFTIDGETETVLMVNSFETGEVVAFPNPGNGLFEISFGFEINSELFLEVRSLTGKLIMSERLSDVQQKLISVDLRNQANGVYLLKISDKERLKVFRVIKQ